MQTFLPYVDFERSARALDARRPGKQRVESLQALRGLTEPGHADTCAATLGTDLAAAGVTRVRSQAELAGAGELRPAT